MIRRLFVKWFLNHDATLVEPAPGVTTFVGPSFSGKSALLRALWWLLTNQPLGDQFVGRWRKAKYALVKAVIDGRTLLRKRGAGVNLYKLDGKTLKAFGQSPPRPASDLANVGPLNLQGQGESYFWFTLSKADLSRRLNEVVGLDVIDRALKAAAAEVRKASARVDVCRERLHDARREQEQWSWASDFKKRVDRLSYLSSQRERLAVKHTTIASAVAAISRAAQTRRDAAEAILGVAAVVRTGQRRRQLRSRAGELRLLVEQLTTTERLISTPIPSPARLRKLRDRRAKLTVRRRALESLVHAADYAGMESESLTEQVKRCEAEVKRRVGETCPVCGQSIRLTGTESSLGTATTGSAYPSPAPSLVRRGLKRRKTTGAK